MIFEHEGDEEPSNLFGICTNCKNPKFWKELPIIFITTTDSRSPTAGRFCNSCCRRCTRCCRRRSSICADIRCKISDSGRSRCCDDSDPKFSRCRCEPAQTVAGGDRRSCSSQHSRPFPLKQSWYVNYKDMPRYFPKNLHWWLAQISSI